MPFKKGFLEAIKPKENLTVSEWADKYRVLPSEGSAEPGIWRTSRTPYLKEIMDELSPQSPTQEVVVIKGVQLGFTELSNNVLFYYADLHPCPMLMVLHTEDIARTHAKTKIWPSIEKMPRLANKITKAKGNSTGSSTLELMFPGGNIKFGWAQTKSTFASVSRRVVIGDDVDRWPLDVGGEGNPVELLKKRTDAFANRKIYINSTPTIKGASNIEKEFNESDQRHFYLPCPHCGEYITFEKENFVFDYDEETYELKGDVKYKCPKCEKLIDESAKSEMLAKGKWIAHNPKASKRGYRLPSYYSPVGWISWNAIFKEYLKALRQQEKYGIDEYMKVWENTRNAKVFEKAQKEQDYEKIFELKIDLDEGIVPDDTVFLVMSVDVQKDHFWYEIRALGYGNKKHVIRYGRVENWSDLEDLFRTYYLDKRGNKYFVKVCAIDSGYNAPEVYEFCAMNSDVCIPVKGKDKMVNPWTTGDAMKEKDGITIATGLKVYTLNTEYFKDMLYNSITRSLKIKEKEGEIRGDNIFTLHKNTDEVFAKQYTSEHKIVEINKKGREVYKWDKVNPTADNHLWDCGVYNTFLGELLGIRFLRKTQKQVRAKLQEKKVANYTNNYLDEF
ncbi:phage terminase large subunit family protein [Caminibacter profundus]